VRVMDPFDRSFAPDVMQLNLVPNARAYRIRMSAFTVNLPA